MSVSATQMNSQIWNAVVGSPIRIPAVNSYVYYFPQGHLENAFITNYDGIHPSPMILCRLLSLDFFSCPHSDEPFLKFHLKPIASSVQPTLKPTKIEVEFKIEQIDVVNSCTKVATQSDTNNGGSFSVPARFAEAMFPPLNYLDKPPQQDLCVKDAHNCVWNFRHIYRGNPLRHYLKKKWTKFVSTKKLAAGDSVVLIKRTRKEETRIIEELFIGIKRKVGSSAFNYDDIKRKALAAIGNAAREMVFEADYYPMGGSLPIFIVSTNRVEASMNTHWAVGMRVNLTSMMSCEGRIAAVNAQVSRQLSQSLWRNLQVSWRDPKISPNMNHLSPWEVECLAPSLSSAALLSAFSTSKKPKFNEGVGPSSFLLTESHYPSLTTSLPSFHPAPFSTNDDDFFPSRTKLLTRGVNDEIDIVSTMLNARCSNSDRLTNGGQIKDNFALTRDTTVTSIRLFGEDIQEGEINLGEDLAPNSFHRNVAWLTNNTKGKNIR